MAVHSSVLASNISGANCLISCYTRALLGSHERVIIISAAHLPCSVLSTMTGQPRHKRALSGSSVSSVASAHDEGHTESSKATRLHSSPSSHKADLSCTLPPTCSPSRPAYFASSVSLSAHYESHHAHVCSECNKMMPSAHFLDLHIDEHHNPLTRLKIERGDKVVRLPPALAPACR